MYWMTFPWPWPKVTTVASISKNFLRNKVRTTDRITTTRGSIVTLVMAITWLDFGEIMLKTVILTNFRMCFFKVKLFWPYLRNDWSDWCETKRKCIGWIRGTICDLDLWPHPWPWPWSFKVRVWNSFISGMGRLTWNEKGVSHPFKTMILTCVTMVVWADVPDSDRGDFRRRRAVDISSFS